MSSKHFVFVYGTLMSGLRNHSLLDKQQCLSKEAYTKDPAELLLLYDRPYMRYSSSGYPLKGELYEINDETLEKLDQLEDHPNWYKRELKKILVLEEEIEAFIYVIVNAPETKFCKRSDDGDFRAYIENYKGPNANDFKFINGELVSINS